MTKELQAAADAYRDEDFKNNPNGYTVGPYLNSEITWDAYTAGAQWAIKHSPEVLALVEALEKLADPRKRDHREQDKYTEVGCMINIADEALTAYRKSVEGMK